MPLEGGVWVSLKEQHMLLVDSEAAVRQATCLVPGIWDTSKQLNRDPSGCLRVLFQQLAGRLRVQ